VPVRMTEAWLLFDVVAIRRAAGNPNGRVPLELPAIHACEGLVNPKDELIKVVRTASGLSVRRQKKLQVEGVAVRVADLIDDFSPLSVLSAFRALQDDVRLLMEE